MKSQTLLQHYPAFMALLCAFFAPPASALVNDELPLTGCSSVQRETSSSMPGDYADQDGDTVPDHLDNCTFVSNLSQVDADFDNIGNQCDADLDNDCTTGWHDFRIMKEQFFAGDPNADINVDGTVDFLDLEILRDAIFTVPGPSGLDNLCN